VGREIYVTAAGRLEIEIEVTEFLFPTLCTNRKGWGTHFAFAERCDTRRQYSTLKGLVEVDAHHQLVEALACHLTLFLELCDLLA
jgi:hypothetical protein